MRPTGKSFPSPWSVMTAVRRPGICRTRQGSYIRISWHRAIPTTSLPSVNSRWQQIRAQLAAFVLCLSQRYFAIFSLKRSQLRWHTISTASPLIIVASTMSVQPVVKVRQPSGITSHLYQLSDKSNDIEIHRRLCRNLGEDSPISRSRPWAIIRYPSQPALP